ALSLRHVRDVLDRHSRWRSARGSDRGLRVLRDESLDSMSSHTTAGVDHHVDRSRHLRIGPIRALSRALALRRNLTGESTAAVAVLSMQERSHLTSIRARPPVDE